MEVPKRIRYHYIKSNAFRVVHVDGVVGGPTLGGLLQAAFYSERAPIPTMVEHELADAPDAPGHMRIGKEVARDQRNGFVREVDVSVMMSVEMARNLHRWLGDQLKKMSVEEIVGDE